MSSHSLDSTATERTDDPLLSDETLLSVRNLSTRFFTNEGQVNAVDGISFNIARGEIFGIVGESGSGKSVSALSIMGMVESPGQITSGEIWYHEPGLADQFRDTYPDAVDRGFVDIVSLPEAAWRSLRGTSFSMIFQDPMSSFDPTSTVGEQIAEAVEIQRRASSNPRSTRSRTQDISFGELILGTVLPTKGFVTKPSMKRAIDLLEQVGIPDPKKRANEYPHQFSGGMLQRAMIAQALAGEPDLLVADEPTTALDVTIQAQILSLLSDLQVEQDMSILLITHNLGVIARICDKVGVMYAGEIVEKGTLEDIFTDHIHPYTNGLLESIPNVGSSERLTPIDGNVPSLLDHEMGDRCYFADRCPKAMEDCLEHPPELDVDDEHSVRCVLAEHDYHPEQALPDDYFADADEATPAGEVRPNE